MPEQSQRIEVLRYGDLAETDVVHNGTDVWTYTSSTNSSTRRTLEQDSGAAKHDAGSDPAENLTPHTKPADISASKVNVASRSQQ